MLDLRVLLADEFERAALVGGVDEREQVHHRDRRAAELLEPLDAGAHGVFVERQEHLAVVRTPFGNRDADPPPSDGDGSRVRRIPDLLLVHATHLDLVAMPAGDEQTGRRAVHLDHRVVGGGGAVHDDLELPAEVVDREPEALCQLRHAVHHADRLVVEGGRRLVEHDLAGRRDADQISERPPTSQPIR